MDHIAGRRSSGVQRAIYGPSALGPPDRRFVTLHRPRKQTLRRSCEIEWAQTCPQNALSRWIGHSVSVSGRHCVNAIPAELFGRIA